MAVSEVAADDLSLVSRRQFISEAPSAVLLLATSRYLSGFEDKSFQTQRNPLVTSYILFSKSQLRNTLELLS